MCICIFLNVNIYICVLIHQSTFYYVFSMFVLFTNEASAAVGGRMFIFLLVLFADLSVIIQRFDQHSLRKKVVYLTIILYMLF